MDLWDPIFNTFPITDLLYDDDDEEQNISVLFSI